MGQKTDLIWDGIERRKALRAQAEAMVALFHSDEAQLGTPEKLLHELLVHKIELELQNEELRSSYAVIAEMRDRYIDLYEHAPVGFLSINSDSKITEINLTGAALFGLDRTALLSFQFAKLIVAEQQDQWHFIFTELMAAAKGSRRNLGFNLLLANQKILAVSLECLRWESISQQALLRIAITNVVKLA